MVRNRNKLYFFLLTACIFGYVWLYLSINHTGSSWGSICFFKQIFQIPCPSCGVTRAIQALFVGHWLDAIMLNPLSLVVAGIMLVLPLWLIADVLTRSSSVLSSYKRVETYLKQPKYAIPLILLVAINWIWNIAKGL